MHDFPDKKKGETTPYGVYDLAGNAGWVSVGTDHDTAEFRGANHPLLVASDGIAGVSGSAGVADMADGGGSNGSRRALA